MKGTWSDLQAMDQVKGKDGFTWIVISIKPAGGVSRDTFDVTLSRDHRAPFSGRVHGEVEVVWSAAQEQERAVAVAQVVLGGEVSGRKGPNGVWLAPAGFTEPGSILAHAYIFHRQTGNGEGTLRELIHWHDELHERDDMEPHHHDPDFYKVNK